MSCSSSTRFAVATGTCWVALAIGGAYHRDPHLKDKQLETLRAMFVKPPLGISRAEHIARVYSLPPVGGAGLVSKGLVASTLEGSWKKELVFRDDGSDKEPFSPTQHYWWRSFLDDSARKEIIEGHYVRCNMGSLRRGDKEKPFMPLLVGAKDPKRCEVFKAEFEKQLFRDLWTAWEISQDARQNHQYQGVPLFKYRDYYMEEQQGSFVKNIREGNYTVCPSMKAVVAGRFDPKLCSQLKCTANLSRRCQIPQQAI